MRSVPHYAVTSPRRRRRSPPQPECERAWLTKRRERAGRPPAWPRSLKLSPSSPARPDADARLRRVAAILLGHATRAPLQDGETENREVR